MTTLTVTNLKHASSSTNNLVLNANGSVTGGGKILQIVTTEKTDTFTGYGQTFFDITGMSLAITPSATSSKILVQVHMPYCVTASEHVAVRLMRDSTPISIGDAGESSQTRCSHGGYHDVSQTRNCAIMYVDSPSSTSAVTYKMQGRTHGNDSIAIGKNGYTQNDGYSLRMSSSITLTEIAG